MSQLCCENDESKREKKVLQTVAQAIFILRFAATRVY